MIFFLDVVEQALDIVEQGYVSTCHKIENRCSQVAVVIKIELH